jgi:surface carbohydrate biosynthesis protein (TIGR04326 family)
VEALRYLHLENKLSKRNQAVGTTSKTILVLGDNIVGSNEKLIEIIYEADKNLNVPVNYVFKSHKARAFEFSSYNLKNFILSNESIEQQLNKSDIVITGNITSAAVDAYYYGLPVATLMDPRTLNSSPLRDIQGVSYFSTVSELIEIINKSLINKAQNHAPYFNLNNDLVRWEKLVLTYNSKLTDQNK